MVESFCSPEFVVFYLISMIFIIIPLHCVCYIYDFFMNIYKLIINKIHQCFELVMDVIVPWPPRY